jgi:hypothetical protein
VDHAFTFLVSKDIAQFHFDFNFTQFLIGSPNASGFDKNRQLSLAFSHIIRGRVQFTGEFYGDTRLNQATPGVRVFAVGADVHSCSAAGD